MSGRPPDWHVRADRIIAAADRVICAFKVHGAAKGVTQDLQTRVECERSMLALEAALALPHGLEGSGGGDGRG